jgi:hypothetical protein
MGVLVQLYTNDENIGPRLGDYDHPYIEGY